jgi:HSP20 family protein
MTVPAVNVTENNNGYNITVAAPGMKKEDFHIDVNGRQLTISSETEQNKEDKEANYTRREYNYSSFSHSFTKRKKGKAHRAH